MGARTRSHRVKTSLGVALLVGLIAVVTLGVSAAAEASLVPLSGAELEQAASTVIAGQVVGMKSRFADGRALGVGQGYIETAIEIEVASVLKGAQRAPGETLTIVVPGGTVDGLTLVVDSSPVFGLGEVTKLYLDRRGRVVGGPQGKRAFSVGEASLYGMPAPALVAAAAAAADEAQADDSGVMVYAAATPTINSINPPSGSAGTGTQVTITGSGFGASKGTGHVDFFYRSGQPTIQASVVSWSDTAIVCTIPTGVVNGYSGSAGSGPVTVTNAGGATSADYSFQVTFGYGGIRWAGTSCPFSVNPNTADTAEERSLVGAAASVWSAASAFRFNDAGTTTATTASRNSANEIFWSNTMQSGILGTAYSWYSGSSLLETDISFNDSYTWSTGSSGTYDIESIALHEMGHWLNLRDLYGSGDSAKIMYGFGSSGQQKRTLNASDAAGIQWIYSGGGSTQVTLTTSVVGSGSVTRLPNATSYTQGSTVTLTAVPASGWTFSGWSGAASGTTNPLAVTMDSNKSITATFAQTPQVPGTTRYEQTDTKLRYVGSWYSSSSSLYSGSSYKYTSGSGASVTAAFTGTAVGYVARTAATLGIARLTLDEGTPAQAVYNVDLYSSITKYKQTVWTVAGLTNGPHTLKIEYTGTKGSGSGTSINLDALDIVGTLTSAVPTRYEQSNASLAYLGTWTTSNSSYYSGGSYRYTNSAGSSVTATFSGTSVAYVARTASSMGIAKLTLDAGTPAEAVYNIDLYSSTSRYKQTVWSVSGLIAGTHSLKIEWTGTRRSGSSGTTVNLDALDIMGTLLTP